MLKKKYKLDPERETIKKKAKQVEDLIAEMKNYKTVLLIELSNLPDSLLQSSRKKLRDVQTKVIVAKKAVLQRVIQSDKKMEKFLTKTEEPVALILSNKTPYELNKFFKSNKKRMAAKAGQTAPYEIVIPEGETDLPPGPALSELKTAGVNVFLKSGKIAVRTDSTIAKAGDKITMQKSKALQMLGILPFEKSVNVLYGYDRGYVYTPEVLGIDEEYVNSGLTSALGQAFNISVNAKYPSTTNIDVLLKDAFMQVVNVSLNAKVYSKTTMEQLLTLAVKQGMVLEGFSAKPEETPKETPEGKKEAPKEEPKEK